MKEQRGGGVLEGEQNTTEKTRMKKKSFAILAVKVIWIKFDLFT